MNVNEDGIFDPLYRLYVEEMAQKLKRATPPKPKTTDQAPSTLEAMKRHEEGIFDYLNMDVDWDSKDWKRDHEISREISPQEYDVYKAMQHSVSRNTLGKEEPESSVTPESKQRAVNVFMCHPPAPLTEAQLKRAKITTLNQTEKFNLEKAVIQDAEDQRLKREYRMFWAKRVVILGIIALSIGILWYLEARSLKRTPLIQINQGKL
jgi:hypothetical protein